MNFHEEIDDIKKWILRNDNRTILFDEPISEIRMLISKGVNRNNVISLFSNYRSTSVWLCHLFLDKIDTPDICKNLLSAYLEQRYYPIRVRILAIDTTDIPARISSIQIQELFFLLLAFNRYEQALWLGGRAYLGDTAERFSGRQDELWTLREVSEWEALGGDEHGWRGIVTRLRRLIPSQREKEASAGKFEDDPMFPYWQEKPLCGYMLRLWLVMSGQLQPEVVPEGHPSCGVYEGLFTNWDHPEALENSLIEACDYHVRRSSEDGDGDYDVPEFSLRPYNVIPFEILAYRNVRRKMGLKTPWPSHPLLDSPFVKNLPDELPPSDDPLLNEVLAAVRKVLPDV
jgi:hypothetical protein